MTETEYMLARRLEAVKNANDVLHMHVLGRGPDDTLVQVVRLLDEERTRLHDAINVEESP